MFVAVCDQDFGHFDVFLAENRLPFIVSDCSGALLPLDCIERGNFSVGEHTAELLSGLGPCLLNFFEFVSESHPNFRHKCLRAGNRAAQ